MSVWCKHFIKEKKNYTFNFIEHIAFYKPSLLPLYINLGKNLTKGIAYKIKPLGLETYFNNKVLLIYDIPEYFKLETSRLPKGINLIKIRQYPGILTNLTDYENFDDFLLQTFSKKSRYKFKSYKKNLERTFNISYKHYYGEITEEEYHRLFQNFNDLLKKRFADKQENNNNLDTDEWAFYKDSSFQLIKEKRASIFVIYENNKPIALSLNYFSDKTLFFAMTVFDKNYHKFNLGKVLLMQLYKWCFSNNIEIFDLSKGYYDYKERWGNKTYNFEYHIFYNPKNLISSLLAYIVSYLFKFKQILRDHDINNIIHKLSFFIQKKSEHQNITISVIKENDIISETISDKIEVVLDEKSSYLEPIIIDFLFTNKEEKKDLKLFKIELINRKIFLLKGKKSQKFIEV
jgi:hypothetical protein